MKIKFLTILTLFICITLPMEAKFSVTDVEYLKGDDFIQLHFVTDDIIPIPDLFYPDEDNAKLIVMRVTDVNFELAKNNFHFNSPIIDNVKIKKHKKFTDVKIKLKEKVNYRVFTNREGLYIEFPNSAVFAVTSKTRPTPPVHAKLPAAKKRKTPKTKPKTNPVKTAQLKTKPPNVYPKPPAVRKTVQRPKPAPGQTVSLKDFKLALKDKQQVRFEFDLSGPVDYNVIPIADAPIRLAIDLKNTQARRIKETVNFLNVKSIRGAYNSPTVYRLVFDLHYLKHYNIALNGNVLTVEFLNKLPDIADAKIKPPKKGAPKLLAGKNRVNNSTVRNKPVRDKQKPGKKNNKKPRNTKPITIDIQGKGEAVVKPSAPRTASAPPSDSIENVSDFFADEKSRVTEKPTLVQDEADNDEEEGGEPSSTSFSKQTIGGGDTKYTGEPYDFYFKDMDLENVLLFFSKISGLSIVIDPGVSGTVTARMYQVPWDQALAYFLRVNKLSMVQEGNLLRIGMTAQLAAEAEAALKFRESQQKGAALETFTSTLSYSKAALVAAILDKRLSPRGEILIDSRTNTLIISEIPENAELLKRIIDTLDVANPQVSIEARIIEVQSNHTRSLGIQWGYDFSANSYYGNQTSLKFPNNVSADGSQYTSQTSPLVGPLGGYAVNLPATGGTSGTVFSLGNIANTFRLDVALSAMASEGKGQIISSPKTTTQNNLPATLSQGKRIPVQTIQNNTVTVQYVLAGVELTVTPQITATGTIICELDIKNNTPDFANIVNNIPPISIQELKTTVMAADGSTIVIGGLLRVEEAQTVDRTPFFSKIPLLGNLFRNKFKRSEQKELLIFITPRILK